MDMADLPDVPRGAQPPKKVNYTHDAVIDQIIARPGISQGQLAQMFGYTQSWLSVVMSSDAFRERLAERRGEVVDPAITASVEERFRAVTLRSLEVLQEKLSQPAQNVPDNLALRAMELGARGLQVGGFGGAKIEVTQVSSGEDRLARLAERLGSFVRQAREPETLDAEIVQESQAA